VVGSAAALMAAASRSGPGFDELRHATGARRDDRHAQREGLHDCDRQTLVHRCQHEEISGGGESSRVLHVAEQSEAVSEAEFVVQRTQLRLLGPLPGRHEHERLSAVQHLSRRRQQVTVGLPCTQVRDRDHQRVAIGHPELGSDRVPPGALGS
jgi:hypothetical protein